MRYIKSIKTHGRYAILAFDKFYTEDGVVDDKNTNMYTPNQYVYDLSMKYPDYFLPTCSVHPYRKDALEELEKWGKKGIKLIKWLPNSQGKKKKKKIKNFPKLKILKNVKFEKELILHMNYVFLIMKK